MLNESVFRAGLQDLMRIYQKDLPRPAVEQWWDAVKELADWEWKAAVQSVIDDDETGTYFPKPVQMLRYANRLRLNQQAPDWSDVAHQMACCTRCSYAGWVHVIYAGESNYDIAKVWIPDENGRMTTLLADLGLEGEDDLPVPWPQWEGHVLRRKPAACACHHGQRRRELHPHLYPALSDFERWADPDAFRDREAVNEAWDQYQKGT